jgi:hypothetical protein
MAPYRADQAAISAKVRFTNNLPSDTVSLSANGTNIFTAVAPGQHTDYITISDSSETFVLMKGANRLGTVTVPIIDKGSYSASAKRGGDDRPQLTVLRDD